MVRAHPRRLPRRPRRRRHRPRRRPRQRGRRPAAAQKAKAWARIGDRRQVEVALDQGRALLEQMPYPENLDNHFAVDPAKWDFYSMDCYRILGATHDPGSTENKLAESYATEVLRLGTDASGIELSPMRNAEARVTLGVISVRQGDLEQALSHGRRALTGDRFSMPSLLMVSRELGTVIHVPTPQPRRHRLPRPAPPAQGSRGGRSLRLARPRVRCSCRVRQ